MSHPRALMSRVAPELALLVAIATALGFCGITWGLPNDSTDWAIDSIAPLGPLSYAADMLRDGHWSSKYPPLHFTVLAVFYAPYLAYLWLTGGMTLGVAQYPYGLADPTTSLTILTLIARSVSASMGVATTVAAYLIARDLAGRRAGFFAGIIFAASPLAVYYAGSGNLDMPYMFWSSFALLCLVRIARGARLRTYVLLGVTTAAAIATKDQAYGLFLLLPIPLLAIHYRRNGGLAPDPRLVAGFAAALVTYAIAGNVVIDPTGWIAHIRFITDTGSVPYQMFPATLAGYGALAVRTTGFLVDSTTAPVLVLAAVGIAWAVRWHARGAWLLVFAATSYLVLFLAPILYVLPRFVLPAVFVLAIFAGIGASTLWRHRSLVPKSIVTMALCYAVTYGISMNLGLLWDSRYAAERWLAQNLEPDAVVGTDAAASYLPRLPPGTPTSPFSIEDVDTPAEPAYLILSDAQYRKYFRHEHLRTAFEKLLAGERGYETVASFHQGGLPVTNLIPGVNPRIVIMRRQRPPSEYVREREQSGGSSMVAVLERHSHVATDFP